jgi:hypothetical protein
MLTVVLVALQAAPAVGVYVLEGGGGSLTIEQKGGAAHFAIEVLGGNAHQCQLEGAVTGEQGTVTGDACTVRFESAASEVKVSVVGADEPCRAWCGVRAWFEGRYLRPPDGCSAKAIDAARATFRQHYSAKAWAQAKADLQPVLDTCTKVLFRFDLAWIRNDLAITLHHLGDDAQCLRTLAPLASLAAQPDDEVSAGEPAFEEDARKLARATRTNLKLCGAKRR